jgi:hypothetical protein
MLTPEIIVGAFTEIGIIFAILTITPIVLCIVFQWVDDYKWNKRYEAEMARLNAEGLARLQVPVVR